jgi:LysM domain
MKKSIIALVIAASLAAGGAIAQTPAAPRLIQGGTFVEGTPGNYVVQKGDTLWGIANRFLKSPWQWPEVWRINNDQIRNPHKIYPGDIIRFDRMTGTASVTSEPGVVKLSPRVRPSPLSQEIPAIPPSAITPFLTRPLIVESDEKLSDAPRVLGGEDRRVIVGTGNLVYVDGIAENEGLRWQIYRPGKAIRDPDTGESLGFDAVFLGEAVIRRFGSPATLEITQSNQEVNRDDVLLPVTEAVLPSYIPRAPEKAISGKILSVQDGISELARFSVVAVNRGKREGLEIGHVLATYHPGELTRNYQGWTELGLSLPFRDMIWKRNPVVPEPPSGITDAGSGAASIPEGKGLTAEGRRLRERRVSFMQEGVVQLPEERNGLVFIFRVYDKVSYGLVLQSSRQISVGDVARKP